MDIINELSNSIDSSAICAIAKQAIANWSSDHEDDKSVLSGSDLVFHSHKLCFQSASVGYPYFESTYSLLKDDKELGLYKVITSMAGEALDDYYEIY